MSVSSRDEAELLGKDDVRAAPSDSESTAGSDDSGCLTGLLEAVDARRQKRLPPQAPMGPSSDGDPACISPE